MSKRFFEVYEIEGKEIKVGCPIDLIILETEEEIMNVEENLPSNFLLKEITDLGQELIDKLAYWTLVYKMETGAKQIVGSVCVDSGQLLITDPCYLNEKKNEELYEEVCKITTSPNSLGQVLNGLAIATSSGYGDGIYDVLAEKDEEGKVISIEIRFD